MREEQDLEASVARFSELVVEWWIRVNGGYMSDGAYVYDTGPVFTGIRCTCIGEDRMRM